MFCPSAVVPLIERSNASSFDAELPARPVNIGIVTDGYKAVRRIVPSRRVFIKSDTDSLPPNDGIHNASPVLSIKSVDSKTTPSNEADRGEQTPGTAVSASEPAFHESPTLVTPLAPRSPPNGHSQWPDPHLDAIIERQGSTRYLAHTSSVPRLQLSPGKPPTILKPQNSVHSIEPEHLHRHSWSHHQNLPDSELQHQRSLSCNDLDCSWQHQQAEDPPTSGPKSCTSSEILHTLAEQPSYPTVPIQAPAQRSPTPPGLPTFGTREAQFIRLIPDRGRRRPRLFSSWRVPNHEIDSEALPTVTSTARAEVPLESQGPSPGLLQRLLAATGMARVVTAPENDPAGRCIAPLPRSVVTTAETSILAIADDGTAVRGRFGNRVSGHGIGQRNLNDHPLGRRSGFQDIEEEVRQIEKACTRMNQEPGANHLQLSDRPYASIDAELYRRLTEASHSSHCQAFEGHPDFLSPLSSGFALPSPAFQPQRLQLPADARYSGQSPPIPPANSPVSLSTAMIDGMRGPPTYAANGSASSNTRRHSVSSFDAERLRSRQQRIHDLEHDKTLSGCGRCYSLFCLTVCGYDVLKKQFIHKEVFRHPDSEPVNGQTFIVCPDIAHVDGLQPEVRTP
jgi:hypothetical protein